MSGYKHRLGQPPAASAAILHQLRLATKKRVFTLPDIDYDASLPDVQRQLTDLLGAVVLLPPGIPKLVRLLRAFFRFYTLQFDSIGCALNIGGQSLLPVSKAEQFNGPPYPKRSLPWQPSEWEGVWGGKVPQEKGVADESAWLSSGRSSQWLGKRPFLTILDPLESHRILGCQRHTGDITASELLRSALITGGPHWFECERRGGAPLRRQHTLLGALFEVYSWPRHCRRSASKEKPTRYRVYRHELLARARNSISCMRGPHPRTWRWGPPPSGWGELLNGLQALHVRQKRQQKLHQVEGEISRRMQKKQQQKRQEEDQRLAELREIALQEQALR
ncbi:hypothetical protein cyc_07361 [Cyclospora cayetanensis]|uniref:Uncharacterized protein n=1 Tax=Cyclospora cayetanensis TaxID=88456 RepID=A0A1D3CVP0_9EIME|nr:hypothetical protein cyc_07361 [Cyclospora cayetanensis]